MKKKKKKLTTMFKARNDQKDWIMKGYDHLENKNKIVLNYSDPIFNFSA